MREGKGMGLYLRGGGGAASEGAGFSMLDAGFSMLRGTPNDGNTLHARRGTSFTDLIRRDLQ